MTDRLDGLEQVLAKRLFLDKGSRAAIINVLDREAPVQITLQELELHRIEVSKTYVPGDLDFHPAEIKQSKPLEVNAVAELAGSEIRIRGHLKTSLTADCDRCLATVDIPIERDFDLFYRPVETIAREEEVELPEEELDVGFFSAEGISMADVVTEQVILSVPMKVLCRPGCLGLCPICKVDRNVRKCSCAPARDSSPFASLRGE